MADLEKALLERIDLYEKMAATAKRQYRQIAAYNIVRGLREALAIVRGENPDDVFG